MQQRGLLIERRNWTVLRVRRSFPCFDASQTQPMSRDLKTSPSGSSTISPLVRVVKLRCGSSGNAVPPSVYPASTSFLTGSCPASTTPSSAGSSRPGRPKSTGQAMDRIERFSTGRTVSRVRRAYERFKGARSCTLAPAALAYFFRVAPGYARAEVGKVMREVGEGERCETGVMPAIAERRIGSRA